MNWVRLKFAVMNLKKLAFGSWRNFIFFPLYPEPLLSSLKSGVIQQAEKSAPIFIETDFFSYFSHQKLVPQEFYTPVD